MGYCAQGPGHVIKITGTKERRQSHNAAGDLVEEEEEKNITSSPPPHPTPPKKWNFGFPPFFKWTCQLSAGEGVWVGGGHRGEMGTTTCVVSLLWLRPR